MYCSTATQPPINKTSLEKLPLLITEEGVSKKHRGDFHFLKNECGSLSLGELKQILSHRLVL